MCDIAPEWDITVSEEEEEDVFKTNGGFQRMLTPWDAAVIK